MRLLSFSSASSPQAPVLTASNGRCMLPIEVVLHSEAYFARQKRPREENKTPPKWPPRTDNKSLRDSPHLVRLGKNMELSMALKVASNSPPPTLTPPKWPPRTDNKSLRDSPHLVRLGKSMELSMALKVASNSPPPTLRSHLFN